MTRYQTIRTATFATLTTFAALAAVGGLALAGAAPAQAHTVAAEAPATISDWHAIVEQAVDRQMRSPQDMLADKVYVVRLGVDFDTTGQATGSRIVQRSGLFSVDQEGRRLARTITYPRLPVLLQGKARTVIIELYFSSPDRYDAALAAAASRREQTFATIRRLETNVQQAGNKGALPQG